MLRGTTVMLGTFTLISGIAGAQLSAAPANRRPAPGQTSRASAPSQTSRPALRIASIAPAQPNYQPPQIPSTGMFTNITNSPGFFSNVPTNQFSTVPTNQPVTAAQPVSFFFVPAILLSDGRIFANFNGVYEEVLRQCSVMLATTNVVFVPPACWVVDQSGHYRVLQRR